MIILPLLPPFYFLVIGYESNVTRSKRSSHFQIKESILGRHRSANNFISTNSLAQLQLSNSSLSSSSTPSITSYLSISPTDQDGRVEIKDNLHPRIVNSLGKDENARKEIDNVVDVPSSENGVSCIENELLINEENHILSTDKLGEIRVVNREYKNDTCFETRKMTKTNNFKSNNACLSKNNSDYERSVESAYCKSNLSTNAVNNVSSHNPSDHNSMLKTQNSFKKETNLKSLIIEEKNVKRDKEEVIEIGRFSPTPTPYVDFPLQFNFGSTYASSVTVFFDES